VWSVLVLALAASACKPRMLVVGLDGASWKVLDPLMEGGYVPTIERLVSNGVKADLNCQPSYPALSCFCPPVWQSIVTGRRAVEHRIFNFPFLSSERRSPTLWDVLRAYGGRSTILSLHNTWPPDPTADVVLSEPAAEIFSGLLFQVENPTVSGPAFEQPDTWTRPVNLFEELGLDELPQAGQTWKPMAMDRVSMEVLDRLALAKRDVPWFLRTTEFDMVLLHSPDRSMHMTWPSIQPVPLGPIDVARLQQIAEQWSGPLFIPPPYQWGTVASQLIEADRHLEELLSILPYDYVVLLSDHGMATTPQGPLPGGHGVPEAHQGIFAMWGPGAVRRGVQLRQMTVLDVAPTLAYVLGLPIADDLPGRFVSEAFEPALLRDVPPRVVTSWNAHLPFR
jgi:hypothetical protein